VVKKYFSKLFLFLSIILLLYIWYKSEIIWDGNSRGYYKSYFIFSLVMFSFSLLSFIFSDRIKKYITISIISIIFAIYSFEYFITFQNNFLTKPAYVQLKKAAKIYKKNTGKEFDLRERKEILDDELKEKKKITLSITPAWHLASKNLNILPLAGISNFMTINCNENGYYSKYLSDRYGFNNPDNEWEKLEYEYIVLGDSFVHGDCVNRPDDIPSQLRLRLDKGVLNLGYGANGPLLELATLVEYIKPNTKKILWIFTDNDLSNLNDEIKNNILIKYLENIDFNQNLINKQKDIDIYLENILKKNLIKGVGEGKFEINKFIKFYNTRLIFSKYSFQVKPEFSKILSLAQKIADKNNSEFYFIYLPQYQNYQFNYDNEMYKNVINTVNSLDINLIDLKHELEKLSIEKTNLFPFNMYGHYTKYGYKVISDIIYNMTQS
tara:strand:- start:916 stop:2226 length:1311 start_codon:yes stop_codon:yes gene_type:complete